MTFTDDDLKKLKEHIKVHFGDFNGECQLTADGLASLVDRLEIAEIACESAFKVICHSAWGQHSVDCAAQDLLEWKAAKK